ncbi:Cdc7p-Dbf4p kinase complex regulatory subunit [Coemansia biformis]|uniref:Cdc7p-Dbf4p kinase complex regulatory subunit n=1 Tax=Coemansia biformis TaxID=1286918 RepID=A0A9W7YG58_9FUNG|nr:Cdc7p-Dbf4p kinase complex regulatory subunit [Coemansia biformis]
MFDASRPATRHPGASPAGRSMLHTSRAHADLLSPVRALATPTRPAQRATLARAQPPHADATGLASPAYSPATPSAAAATAATPTRRGALQAITNKEPRQGVPDVGAGAAGDLAAASKAAAGVAAEQQREQQARVAEWIFAYRRAFPSFVFYFEGIDQATVQRLSAPIRSLGAKVETFFSAPTVTHVIVEHGAAGDENAAGDSDVVRLARKFQLKIWDVTKLEKRVLGMLLPGYSASAAQGPSVLSAKRKLSEAFSAEKLYAMRHKTFEGASVAHCVDFYYFKYFYLLVEDATHLHRPALMEDYRPPEPGRDPPWPKLYMVPTGRCPFVQYEDPTTSSKDSDTDIEDNKENMTPEPEPTLPIAQPPSKTPASRLRTPHRAAWTPSAPRAAEAMPDAGNLLLTPTRPSRGAAPAACLVPPPPPLPAAPVAAPAGCQLIMDSNASGIAQSHAATSTSTAFNLNAVDPAMQRSLLQNLNGGRVTHLSRLEQPVAASPRIAGQSPTTRLRGRAPPIPRTAKPRVPARRPAVARPGYCENCRAKFDDMLEHVRSPQHRRFATNERNWTDLDAVIDRVRRPLRLSQDPPSADSLKAAYVLSSDEGSHSGAASSTLPGAALGGGRSLDASWGSNPSTNVIYGSALASAQLLASGRLSTEAPDAADGAHVAAPIARPATSMVYLSYSATSAASASLQDAHDHSELLADGSGVAGEAPRAESSEGPLVGDGKSPRLDGAAATPVSARGLDGAGGSIEALVSSLETPRFRNSSAECAYDDGATLVGDELARRKRAKHSTAADHSRSLVTPTRQRAPGAADMLTPLVAPVPRQWQAQYAALSGGATLVQPARTKHLLHARDENDTLHPTSDRLAMAGRLGHMLHSNSGTP